MPIIAIVYFDAISSEHKILSKFKEMNEIKARYQKEFDDLKSQNEKQDFWQATLQAIENDLDGNTYDNGKWSIGVEDISMAMDPDHRSIVIRQIFTTDLQKNTVMI